MLKARLAPLRFEDAVSIATSRGHDGPQTVGALVAAGAGPLASRPLTLKMLLDDPPPASSAAGVVELYQHAVRRLVTERDRLRDAPTSLTSPEEAVPAARRVAAALLFGGKSAVTSSHENPGADELAVDDLVVGDEPSRIARTVITADLIRSTLDSALFTSRGAGRLGFAHFSYAEHLAAEWLAENELGHHQLKQLLMSRDGAVLPELRNVAAWLMARNATVYGWLAAADPDVVLAAAVPIESEEVCARATAQVLSEAKTRAWDHGDYRGLRHPGLAGQLRAALSSSDLEERLLAAELAGDCEVRDVEPELLAIVLDARERSTMRVRAAAGIAAIHRESPTDALVAIVRDPLLAESGELLGVALHASWPHALDVPAVLAALAPPGRPHVLDAFRMFVNYTFAPALTVEDLGAALPWLDELEAQGANLDAFDGLVDRIVTLACEATDGEHDSVLARLIWRRVQAHEPLISSHGRQESSDPLADAGRRRAVLLHVLAEGLRSGETDLVYSLAYGPAAGVCRPEDFGWLATIAGTHSPELSAASAQLAVRLFTPDVESCREDLLAFPESNPVRVQLQFWLGSRRVDDPRRQVWRSRRRQLEAGPTNEEVENSIARELVRVDDGELDGFWAADLLLAIPLDGRSASIPADVDFEQSERWTALSVATQEHFVQAAERYVNGAASQPDEWLGKPVLHHPSRSGVHALILLRSRRRAVYRALPEAVWAKWAPSVLDAIRFTGAGSMESLFVDARTFAVDELRTSAVRLIESQLGGEVFLKSEILESLWSPAFEDALLDDLGRRSAKIERSA